MNLRPESGLRAKSIGHSDRPESVALAHDTGPTNTAPGRAPTKSAAPLFHTNRTGSAFVRLAVMSGKDMLRNPLTGFSTLFMFATVLTIYVSMGLAFTALGPTPVVSITPTDAAVTASLNQAGVEVVGDKDPRQNARVAIRGDRASIVLDASTQPAWNPIWIGLRDAGLASAAITVTDTEGEPVLDPLRENLGLTAMLGIASVAFIGTTVPLVAMRERGLLRLFGTTPLRRSTLLYAQLPARALLIMPLASTTVAIAVWQRYVDDLNLLGLSISLLLGTAMLLAFGMLFATRARQTKSIQEGMAMLTITLVFASGGLLPASIIPAAVQVTMNCLPTTWLAAAAGTYLTGAEPFLPLPILWTMMAITAVAVSILAIRLFVWDQQEPRITRPAQQRENRRTS